MKQISNENFRVFTAMCKAAGLDEPGEFKAEFEPIKKPFWFGIDSEIWINTHNPYAKTAFNYRSTENLCRIASKRTIIANKISAWLDEYGSGEVEHQPNKKVWFIYYNTDHKKYKRFQSDFGYPGTIYMSGEDADKLIIALNNGELKL